MGILRQDQVRAKRRRRDTCAGCHKWRSKKRRLYRLSGARYCERCGTQRVMEWNQMVAEELRREVREAE